jgi:hypothetical protein
MLSSYSWTDRHKYEAPKADKSEWVEMDENRRKLISSLVYRLKQLMPTFILILMIKYKEEERKIEMKIEEGYL